MRRIAPAVVALALLPAPARANHTEFDFAVERFEADGNVHGTSDGAPDLVDEFDDGVFGGLFAPGGGTASEQDGALHLRSPGFHVAIPGLTPVPVDTSEVVTQPSSTFFQDGQGDLMVRSFWRPQPLDRNDWIHMSFSFLGPNGFEFAGLALSNFTENLGDLYYPPFPSGYVMTAHHDAIGLTGRILSLEHQAVDPSAITGTIVLELRLDDAADTITARYSLDGGATFAQAFSPIPVAFLNGVAWLYLGADPRDAPCPGELTFQKLFVGRIDRALGEQRMALRGVVHGGANTVFTTKPLRLVLTDDGAGGAALLDVTLPDWTTGTQQACGPGDGWQGSRRGHRYVNVSGAIPPTCAPGSAKGIRDVRLDWNGSATLRVKARNAPIPGIVGPVTAAVYRSDGPVDQCDGYAGTIACRLTQATAKCE